MEKRMKETKIPNTDSISELAAFWDTHDVTNFEDELEEVHEAVFECLPEETVTIHLPARWVEVVKRMAHAKGIERSALIRKWVLEKLDRV